MTTTPTTPTTIRPWTSPQYGRCARCEADADRRLAVLSRQSPPDVALVLDLPPECGYCRQYRARHMDLVDRLAQRQEEQTWRPAPRVPSVCITSIDATPVDWLWEGYIPAGMITVIDGDPGLGKSYISIDLAARVSRGLPMPPGDGAPVAMPAGVLLCNAEDDPARTIRPRLEAAGADLSRIHLPDLRDAEGRPRPVVLPDDLPALEAIVTAHGVRLVVIDPLMAFLTGKVDSHKDSDIRRVLHQLKELAERTQAAIVIIRHLNKLVSVSDPMYRGGGSIGIIGAARSAFLVGRHPDDDGVSVLARTKGNLCGPPPALAYSVDGGRLAWCGEVDLSASDLLARQGGPGRPSDALDKATEFLTEFLSDGERLARDAVAKAKTLGITERTLERAKKDLGVVSVHPITSGGPWGWRLPGESAKILSHNFGGVDSPAENPGKSKEKREVRGESAKIHHSGRLPPSTTHGAPEGFDI